MLEEYLIERSGYINKKVEDFFPKIIDQKWILENFNIDHDLLIFNEIVRPIWDLLDRGGKRWRPILMLLCCDSVGGGSKVEDLIPLVEIIHNGTLMIDDVEDNSDIRRGKPCIHKIFGTDVAINTGNLMYYLPYLIINRMDIDKKLKLKIYELINKEMLNLSIGQGMDIYWHSGGTIMNEELYLKMCGLKTGTLARLSAQLGALLGKATKKQIKALGRFAESIGIAFQIQDDILNITNKKWGKEFGDDISEGKRTIMVIKLMEIGTTEDKKRLNDILLMKTKNIDLINEAVDLLIKYDTISYAKNKAKELVQSAWSLIELVIDESESKQKLKLFADFLINREI